MRNFFGFHLDSIGFWASAMSALHCALLPLFVVFFSWSSLRIAGNGFIEPIVISITLLLAVISLWSGYIKHSQLKAIYFLIGGVVFIAIGRLSVLNVLEVWFTVLGACLLAVAHYINWKLSTSTIHQHQKSKN